MTKQQNKKGQRARCEFCGEAIVLERVDDPWFHVESGEEHCEGSEEFASPAGRTTQTAEEAERG